MKVLEIFESSSAKPARMAPAGTFTPMKPKAQAMDPKDPNYDWRNPNHNPSGKKPEGPKKPTAGYRKSNCPVLDSEHGTHLFDATLVAHLKDEYPDWNKMSELEQIECQLDWIAPPPRKGADAKVEEEKLRKRALQLQSEIKR